MREIARRLIDGVWRTVDTDEGGGNGGSLLSAEVALSNAQIASLPSTPVEVIAAPGAGNVIAGIAAILRFRNGGGYGNISADCLIGFRYDYAIAPLGAQLVGLYEAQGGVSSFLDVGEDTLAILGINAGIHPLPDELAFTNEQVAFPAVAADKALLIGATNSGDFTSGGAHQNALSISVLYAVIADL